jgi:hypothetical protein
MTVQGITVESEAVRLCREAREAFAAGQRTGAQLSGAVTDSAEVTDADWLYYLADTVRREQLRAAGGRTY